MIANGYRFPFGAIRMFWLYNIALNVIVSFKGGIVHCKMINFMLCEFYLNNNNSKKPKIK